MLGSLLQGNSLPIAIDRAVQFISQCIKASDSYEYPRREGVLLERELPLLHTTALIGSYEEFRIEEAEVVRPPLFGSGPIYNRKEEGVGNKNEKVW